MSVEKIRRQATHSTAQKRIHNKKGTAIERKRKKKIRKIKRISRYGVRVEIEVEFEVNTQNKRTRISDERNVNVSIIKKGHADTLL